jgi:hypothetical protein
MKVGLSPLVVRVVVALALVGLVAFASTAGSGGDEGAPAAFGFLLLALGGVVVLAVVLIGLATGGLSTAVASKATTKLMVGTAVVGLLAAVAALALWSPWIHGVRRPPTGFGCFHDPSWYRVRGLDFDVVCPGGGRASSSGQASPGHGGGGGSLGASVALAVAGSSLLVLLVGGVALAIVARRRRSARSGEDGVEGADVVVEALVESIYDLRGERDVRRAIVACYARMERAFAGSGSARRPHEAPFEYLARVLERIAAGPGRSLTELFERAKFSVEPMGAQEKEQAIAALERLRREASA